MQSFEEIQIKVKDELHMDTFWWNILTEKRQ